MGHAARLRFIRTVAYKYKARLSDEKRGALWHISKKHALHRHLDSVSPETPIWDIVDRCQVWESHGESR